MMNENDTTRQQKSSTTLKSHPNVQPFLRETYWSGFSLVNTRIVAESKWNVPHPTSNLTDAEIQRSHTYDHCASNGCRAWDYALRYFWPFLGAFSLVQAANRQFTITRLSWYAQ